MRTFLNFFFVIFLVSSSSGAYAQLKDFCATDRKVQEAFLLYPTLERTYKQSQKENDKTDAEKFRNGYKAEKTSTSIFIIPVVFHIIHENGTENISDAQIQDAVRILVCAL